MHQNNHDAEVTTQEFNTVRSKFFTFQTVRSILIAKLKTKAEICKFKLDPEGDGNLMSIRM